MVVTGDVPAPEGFFEEEVHYDPVTVLHMNTVPVDDPGHIWLKCEDIGYNDWAVVTAELDEGGYCGFGMAFRLLNCTGEESGHGAVRTLVYLVPTVMVAVYLLAVVNLVSVAGIGVGSVVTLALGIIFLVASTSLVIIVARVI